ncbi:replication initiation and membrane attachment family protein [Staphylococcus lugdunensis]|uniref:replication initiation and membrane attachment family protein n=1 Tax=Staphylococcus lugdunensis TaxID=28035 RepID=UPI0037497271
MTMQAYQFDLRPRDSFEVIRHFELSQAHLEILNRLYAPLIGTHAIGLYHYLNQFVSENNQELLTHYIIMNELKVNLLDFRKTMDYLEGIGLLKSFVRHQSDNSNFIYELIQPPTAYQFFNDPMLSVFLFSEVDKKRFVQLKQYFEQDRKDLTNYQNITHKFTEVFKMPNKDIKIDSQNIKSSQYYKGLDLSNEHFDFELLKELLQHHFISSEIVTDEAKALILQLATLYGLTVEAMKRMILNSITSAQTLSFEELRKQARSYYLIEHEQQLPKLAINADKYYDSESQHTRDNSTNTKQDEWLSSLDNISPVDMLSSWSGSEPTHQQKLMIEELVSREKLPLGVINILLQFVMLKNEMMLPKKYIFEVASNWKKLGISNAKEAYERALKMNEPKQVERKPQNAKNRYYGKQIVSREKTPKWLENRDTAKRQEKIKKKDDNLEKDRQQFLEQLKKDWGDD